MAIAPRLVSGLAGVLLGLVAGSFLATLAVRWPRGEGIVRGRSHCDSCGRTLGVVELVPVVGFLVRRGVCRGCGAPIDRRHLLIELGCAMVGALATATHGGWDGVGGAVFGWLLLTLAVLDAEHLWLPDALTAPLLIAGLAAAALGAPPPLTDRLVGAATGFALLELVRRDYRRLRQVEGMGAGDPKLMAAIGAWLGWQALPLALLGAALLGLLWAALLALAGRAPGRRTALPFGSLLAAAGWTGWLLA